MTQQRRDNHSTEFGLWLRKQEKIDSKYGFVTTNIDFVWSNYKTNYYMFIEEKRYGWMPKDYQTSIFKLIDLAAKNQEKYYGFHLLVFTETNPDDGLTILDGREITGEDLIDFLCFEKPLCWYKSHFPPRNVVRISKGYVQSKVTTIQGMNYAQTGRF
jgi:hypothetical protein